MLEKALAEYSPQELGGVIEDHLENTPGFVGKNPHPAFEFLQKEKDKRKIMHFFWGFATENMGMSYNALPVLSDLASQILIRAGIRQADNNRWIIDPNVITQVQVVLKNLSEEMMDPVEGKPHVFLWEELRREAGYKLGKPVENDNYINYSTSWETWEASELMTQAINNRYGVTGLLSLAHAEAWMVKENGIMLPAAVRAGISPVGQAAIRANMVADQGHGPASAKAAIELAQHLPVSGAQMMEVFDRSKEWRMKFYDQWERWIA